MSLHARDFNAPGLQHYKDVLTLTGRQYRLSDQELAVGIVFGLLDVRTGRMPIGLVDAQNAYWDETLYYDANRRTIDVYDQNRWASFIDTYAGGRWLLSLVGGLGNNVISGILQISAEFAREMRYQFLLQTFVFGLLGFVIVALGGYIAVYTAFHLAPYFFGGIAVWLVLYGIIAFERHARCNRVARRLETLIERQLMPVFV